MCIRDRAQPGSALLTMSVVFGVGCSARRARRGRDAVRRRFLWWRRRLGRGISLRRLPALSLLLWWGLSEFKRFEGIVEIGFVLVHPIAIFRGGDIPQYCGTNVVYCVGSCRGTLDRGECLRSDPPRCRSGCDHLLG